MMTILHEIDRIHREVGIIKKNKKKFGVEKYNNWNEKFTTGAQ